MRIYAVADIHGQKRRIEMIERRVAALHPHVLVVAGDLTGYPHDVATVAALNEVPVPVLFVPGNIDAPELNEWFGRYANIASLHLKEVTMGGISFTGLGGIITGRLPAGLLPEGRLPIHIMEDMTGPNTVLVTHEPPWGVLDRGSTGLSGGSKALLGAIQEKQPRVLICGHMHDSRGIAFAGETMVVNCSMGQTGAGVLIDLKPDQPAKAVLLS